MSFLPRRRRSIFFLFRWIVVSMVAIYLVILLQVHKLAIRHDANHPWFHLHSSSKIVTGILPNMRRSNETTGDGHDSSGFGIPSNIRNGLLEGHVQDYTTSGKDLWAHSSVIPQWMKNYFQWHTEQRALLRQNPEHWDQLKYYLVECTTAYEHCGGTADRLGPLPFHVRIASSNNRLLLIKWRKPAPLEEFLLPPMGGVDWRVPDWLFDHLQQESATRVGTVERDILKFSAYKQARVLRVKFQSHFHGQEAYDARRISSTAEPSFGQVYHDLWRVVFTPAPPIAALIEQQMKELQLVPGTYITIHLRALYAVKEREEGLLQWWSQNSIHCATTKLPTYHDPSGDGGNALAMPILFVSDSTFSTKAAKSYAHDRGIDVVHRKHSKPPLHLEKAENWSSLDATDFYDTFVDLYMIGMSQCTAYNMGGFGRWGSLIGYNSSCVFQMFANMIKCDFTSQGRTAGGINRMAPKFPLFLPPMATST